MEHAGEFAQALTNGAATLGLVISPKQLAQFTSFYQDLQRWNRKTNLTAIRDPREIAIKHFVDSLAVSRALPSDRSVSLLDVGTGAGFPGIPLKLYRPELTLTLLEPTQKKVAFLRHVIGSLELPHVDVYAGTVQELARKSQRRYTHEVTRALRPDDLYPELASLLDADGHLLLCQTKALRADEVPSSFELAGQYEYELPNGYGKRCVTALKLSLSESVTNRVPRGTSTKNGPR